MSPSYLKRAGCPLLFLALSLLLPATASAALRVGVAPIQGTAKYPLVMAGIRQVLLTDLDQTGMFQVTPVQATPDQLATRNLTNLAGLNIDVILVAQFIEGTPRFTITLLGYDVATGYNLGSQSIQAMYSDIRFMQDKLLDAAEGILRTSIPPPVRLQIAKAHTNRMGAVQAMGEADAAVAEKRYVDAFRGFARARALDPNFKAPRHQLEVRAQEFVNKLTDSADLGNAFALMGNVQKSIESYDQALAKNPNHAGALLGKGDLLLDTNRPAEALAFYERAEKIDPRDPRIPLGMARSLEDLKRPSEAILMYEKARSLGATDPEVYEALAASYTARRNTRGAVEAYRAAVDFAERKADFDRARGYYAEINRIAPTASGLEKEGDLFLSSGEIQLAITTYTKALFVEANRDTLFAKLGYAYYLNQQPTEAVKKLKRALELNPANYDANYYLGVILVADRESRAQAVKYLETAARLKPDDVRIQFMLAQAYLSEGRVEASVNVLEKLAKMNPRNASVHKELGDAYQTGKDLSRAEISYNRAVEIQPDYREAHEALAKLYLKLGMNEKAIVSIQRVYAIDATNNAFVSEGSDLLGSLVSAELINLARRFPKFVESGVGHSSINQVALVRQGGGAAGRFEQWMERLFTFYRLDDRKIRSDFELALLAQYRVIQASAGTSTLPDPISPEEFGTESYLDTALLGAGLDGLFAFQVPSYRHKGNVTEVTIQPALFSRIDRGRYPSGDTYTAVVSYPTAEVLRFNFGAVVYLFVFVTLVVGAPGMFLAHRARVRGKGNLRVLINYDPKLESFLTLKLSKKQEEERDSRLIIVKDRDKYERRKYKNLLHQRGAWVRRMVGKETVFQGVPAREYFCYLYGTIEDRAYLKKTVGNYYMVQRVSIVKGETREITFQLEKEEAFVTVFVTKGEQELAGAEIRVEGRKEAAYSRVGTGTFIYLKEGDHRMTVTHDGRTVERMIYVRTLDDQIVNVDLQTADEAEQAAIGGRSLIDVAAEFKEQGRLEDAAKLYEKAGDAEQAGEVRAEALINEGNFEAAAQEFLKKKDFLRAADMYRQLNRLDRADYCYGIYSYQQGDYAKALEYLKDSDQHAMLAKIHEKLGDTKAALRSSARACLAKGQKLEAAQFFTQAEAWSDAAELYETLGDPAKAALLYAKDGNYSLAGELFARAGDKKKAAMAFDRGGLVEQAIAIYRELNEIDKVIELLERQGLFFEAAQAYRDQGLIDEAIAMCQKVPAGHADSPRTLLLLANMFSEKGHDDLALKTFGDALTANAGGLDAESMYAYAALLEKTGNFGKALALLEEILKKDFHFKDVSLRIEEVRKKARTAAQQSIVTETVAGAAPRKELRYELIDELGRGAMGVVYRAKDKMLDRVVAFKTLPHTLKEDPGALESLMKEAQTAAKLNHPNIVTVYDVGNEGGNYFMAMEFVEGKTLQQVLKQVKKVNLPNFLFIAKSLCDVVSYAHEQRVIHRDIKPSNIILLPNRMVKLMDFGLAKVLQDMSIDKTMLRGTPLYMSPEQVLGKDIDHRTDLYSLGVLFFEMLAGRPPFFEGDIMYAHLHTPPPALKDFVGADVPPGVVQTIMNCLSKDKNKRPATAAELAKGLGLKG